MIRKDKNDENYVLIDYVDLLVGAGIASKQDNQEMSDKLCILFSDLENKDLIVQINGKDCRRVEADSDVVKFLKEEANIIDYDKFINIDMLTNALVRAYYEFNHEMKNKLSIYFRKYTDNEINGISNDVIINQIINDKELLDYIKKYDNFSMYISDKIDQIIDVGEKTKRKRG